MTFSHYTGDALLTIAKLWQHVEQLHPVKPCGLWIGDDDGELSWREAAKLCREPEDVQYRYAVEYDKAKVLHIGTMRALIDFDGIYGIDPVPQILFDSHISIDWNRVARDYGGVIISPYQYQARLDVLWYYGWDISSGCIWDPACVTKLERIEEDEAHTYKSSGRDSEEVRLRSGGDHSSQG